MSLFDDLFEIAEEYDRIKEEQKLKTAAEKIDNVKVDAAKSPSWLEAKSEEDDSTDKKGKELPPIHNTQLKLVDINTLVWAKCDYYTEKRNYCPGRIATASDAACQVGIPQIIPNDVEVIEFFNLPKKIGSHPFPQFIMVKKRFIVPFNKSFNNSGKQVSLRDSFALKISNEKGVEVTDSEKIWDTGYDDNLLKVRQ